MLHGEIQLFTIPCILFPLSYYIRAEKNLCALSSRTEVYSCVSKAIVWSENTETGISAFHLHLEHGKFKSALLISTSSL